MTRRNRRRHARARRAARRIPLGRFDYIDRGPDGRHVRRGEMFRVVRDFATVLGCWRAADGREMRRLP